MVTMLTKEQKKRSVPAWELATEPRSQRARGTTCAAMRQWPIVEAMNWHCGKSGTGYGDEIVSDGGRQ
jgi:hypothetical protein